MRKHCLMLLFLFVAINVLAAPFVYMKTYNLAAGDIPVVSGDGKYLIPSGYKLSDVSNLVVNTTSTSNAVTALTGVVASNNVTTVSNLNVLASDIATNTSNLNVLAASFETVSNMVSVIWTNYTPLAVE